MTRRLLLGAAANLFAATLFAATLLAATALVGAPAAGAASTPAWLGQVNTVRSDAGDQPVTVNASWVAGIKAHLTYLAKTPARQRTGQYANAHTENPHSKYYSEAGAQEAASSDLAFGTAGASAAIDAWLAAPFHAIGMLRPGLTAVAFYRDPKTGDAGLDVISGLGGSASRTAVLFPRKATGLSRFGGESPDPTETCRHLHSGADYSQAGLPLVALLPGLSSTKHLSATLTRPDGSKVSTSSSALCLVDARDFYSTDPVYGPTGKQILQSDRAVLLIPRTPLRKGTYHVTLHFGVTYHGHVPTWSFVSHPG